MTTETTKTTVDFLIDQLDDKRIYRIYRELELNMRIKPRKRLVREQPEPLAVPYAHNEIWRSEEHTSELQSLMRISYAVFCLKKKTTTNQPTTNTRTTHDKRHTKHNIACHKNQNKTQAAATTQR